MKKDVVIFPEPQELKIGRREVVITPDTPVTIRARKSSRKGFFSEEYTLKVSDGGVVIEGGGPAGNFYAMETLKQLAHFKNGRLTVPEVKIRDWPDYKYRGLFIENKWGSDLMTLQDWKDLIDFMASIKLNVLGIGVYGCWCVQYENKITEFFFLPLKKYPDLKTPKRISYYSPSSKKEITIDYLPKIFKQDFFGEIIAYGKKRNVIVFPHFNSLGHNTLIPRLYPEISSKESNGSPTNYGFCLTNPDTYKMLFDIYDEIIDRYLKPNGIDIFHVQLDEVYETNGVDFKDLYRKVDPWCKCRKCLSHTKKEIFLKFLTRIARHLKKKGMKKIILYADYISKMGLLDKTFSSRLKKEGFLNEVAIDCWWYTPKISPVYFPSGVHSKLSFNLWVKPMTCYFNWDWYGNYLENIFAMLRQGYKENAEGVQSYSVYDYGYHQNYYCLAEYSWNQKNRETLEQFREKYARLVFGAQWRKGEKVLDEFEKILTEGETAGYISRLPYYRYTYVAQGRPYPRHYPQELIESLSADLKKSYRDLKRIIEKITPVEKGLLFFKKKKSRFSSLIGYWLVECRRIKNLCSEFLIILEIGQLRKVSPLSKRVIDKLKRALKLHDEIMATIEKVKSSYIIPGTLGNLMPLRNYLLENIKEYKKLKKIQASEGRRNK